MDVRACGVLGGLCAAAVWLAFAAAVAIGCSSSANSSSFAATGGDGGGGSPPPDATTLDAFELLADAALDAADAVPDAAGPNCAADGGSGTFTCTGSMLVARDVPGGATLPDGKVLVAGGWNAQQGVLSSAELFDPAAGTFSPTGSMASGHLWAGWGAPWPLVESKVLVVGGLDTTGALTGGAELYDPVAGTFGATGSLTGSLEGGAISMAPVVLDNGAPLFIGGWNEVSQTTRAQLPNWSYTGSGSSAVEIFEVDGGVFVPTGSLAEPRLFGCNVRYPGGALAIGGAQGPSAIESNIERFDLEAGAWTSVGSLMAGTFCARAFVLPAGKVLLTGTGGLSGATVAIPGTLLLDFDGGAYAYSVELTKNALANYSPNLVQLANGDVLAFGGTLSGAPTAVAQVYDAGTNTWRTVGSLTQTRSGAVGAYLLASGDVLIAGGEDESGMPLATAEVYHP